MISPPPRGARRRSSGQPHDYPHPVPRASLARVASLAAQAVGFPIGGVGIVRDGRIVIASNAAVAIETMPLEGSFLELVAQTGPQTIEDLSKDPRFARNPFVQRGPRVRHAVGHPLHDHARRVVGVLAISSPTPQKADPHRARLVAQYAAVAEEVLECHARRAVQAAVAELLDSVSASASTKAGAQEVAYPRETLRLLGRRWTANILEALADAGPLRFSELEVRLAGISSRTLSDRLRELVQAGLVTKRGPSGGHAAYALAASAPSLS